MLYEFLEEIIYIEQQHLFELNPDLACCLRLAIYGLKRALQAWYPTLANFLNRLGLELLELDHCVFVLQDRQLRLAIYVDNFLFFGSDNFRLRDIQDQLNAQFQMTNLREVFHYLGIEIDVEVGK